MSRPYYVETKPGQRMVAGGDIHFPAEEPAAVELFKEVVRFVQPDYLVQLGDAGNFQSISKFGKLKSDPTSAVEEMRATRVGMLDIKRAAPRARGIICTGNHDVRLEIFLYDPKNAALEGSEELDFEIQMGHAGWEVVPYNEPLVFNDNLQCIHTGKANTILEVRENGISTIYGHTHHASLAYGGAARGPRHVAMNAGWLGSRSKTNARAYTSGRKADMNWMHAVVLVDFGPDGLFSAQLIPFIESKGRLLACVDRHWCAVSL